MSSEPHLDSVRAAVRGWLLPLLPSGWDIKPGLYTPTTLAKPTLFLEYSAIEPLPEAPLGHVRCSFELTLTTELTDPAKGEEWVDPAVVDLVLAIDAHPQLAWSRAEKRVIKDTYLAWTLTVSVLANTTPTPPTDPDPAPDDPEE
ncbi:hypothetical protein [uncultured Microbacterium sp.]|uniref:hypothetical protein n=1 Tax=uncultured Microbacterium sp. TaxID=191216 RepID=UPI000960367B|nr:hypothetical protein [uncultured Microbacterium sp.]MBN9141086.1 hypothetical protein [Micrococcales bacterium]OJX69722.1 MAG: hypothetical protein BGO94_14715 [Micrococcales bacterium 72-143]